MPSHRFIGSKRRLSAWYEEVIGIFGGKGSTGLRGPYLMNGEGVILRILKLSMISWSQISILKVAKALKSQKKILFQFLFLSPGKGI